MIGKRLKTFRKKIGLTQTELGKELGVTLGTIQNWEAETRSIKDSIIQLLAVKYNLNESWMKSGEGEMFVEEIEKEETSEDLKELFQLIKQYASPKMITEFKDKLLKIKRITDESD